jgi:phosphatidate cytidylyltransferase
MPVSRIVVALIFIPLLLAAVLLRGPLLVVIVSAATLIACAEYAWMFHQRDIRVSVPGCVAVGLAFIVPTVLGQDLGLWLVVAMAIAALLSALGPGSFSERAAALALLLVGASYIGFLTRFALLIGQLPQGDLWGATVLFTDWAADTAGFFVGRRMGRHLLAPDISPKKTWEGAAGSLLGAAACVALMSLILPIPAAHILLLGVAIGSAAIGGDLLESYAKRAARVKDASTLLAGHGGFLDRMDSLLPVLAIVYAYAVFVAGASAP